MAWFAVRSVYKCGQKSDGRSIFEERIVCFEAESADDAISKATIEAQAYAARNQFEVSPDYASYEQDGESLIDGYEVWSTMFEADMSLREFHEMHYQKFDYHPE